MKLTRGSMGWGPVSFGGRQLRRAAIHALALALTLCLVGLAYAQVGGEPSRFRGADTPVTRLCLELFKFKTNWNHSLAMARVRAWCRPQDPQEINQKRVQPLAEACDVQISSAVYLGVAPEDVIKISLRIKDLERFYTLSPARRKTLLKQLRRQLFFQLPLQTGIDPLKKDDLIIDLVLDPLQSKAKQYVIKDVVQRDVVITGQACYFNGEYYFAEQNYLNITRNNEEQKAKAKDLVIIE